MIGLGDSQAQFQFIIANRPPFGEYPTLASCRAMMPGEIDHIVSHTSNHWRKVFNVYAKVMDLYYTDAHEQTAPAIHASANLAPSNGRTWRTWRTWQEYRDTTLFQQNSNTLLRFDIPDFACSHTQEKQRPKAQEKAGNRDNGNKHDTFFIIAGKTHAAQLKLPALHWLDSAFAVAPEHRIIVAPYPDYRQLSNARIAQLIGLVHDLSQYKGG